jgi:ABC-2 type transport system ATP-binding protein
VLSCTDLEYSYGPRRRLKGISFSANAGALIALFGHNGCGKSTLLKLLSGVLPVQKGSVSLEMQSALNPEGYLRHDLRARIGVLFQGTSSDEKLSAADNLKYAASLMGVPTAKINEKIEWALLQSGLKEHAYVPVKKLSGGMRRRLELYRTFLHRPQLVLLDEPTAGLDILEARRFFSFLKNYQNDTNALVIMSSHHPDELLACHEVIMMHEGEICAQGSPVVMLNKLDYLRCSFSLHRDHDRSPLVDLDFFALTEETDGVIKGKIKGQEIDSFFKSSFFPKDAFKSFSVEKPSLADFYEDICVTRGGINEYESASR